MTALDTVGKSEPDDDPYPFTPEGLDRLMEDSANMYDDWWAARGITTLRRRYKNERDALLKSLPQNKRGDG